MKKAFSALSIITAVLYGLVLYYMLFQLFGRREMVIMSEDMLASYNYWNAINLVPFTTIGQYIKEVVNGSIRGHAMLNLAGNLFLLFPAGFYLPFFVRKMGKPLIYSIAVASLIIAVEVVQVLTMTGSLDIDDFILNFAGAIIGFIVFRCAPFRAVFNLRCWS